MAIASLVLGCVGFITWLIPLFGFPTSILGIIFGVISMKKQERPKMALAGFIISIVTLVITTFNSAIGAYESYMGFIF